MFTRALQLLLVLLCIIAFVGCEGEVGPAGPAGATGGTGPPGQDGDNVVLVYADMDVITGVDNGVVPLGSGPVGVIVTGTFVSTGNYDVTITGSFPANTGVLMVSVASDQLTLANVFIAASITSWSTTQIDITVDIRDSAGVVNDEDFSFVILGE